MVYWGKANLFTATTISFIMCKYKFLHGSCKNKTFQIGTTDWLQVPPVKASPCGLSVLCGLGPSLPSWHVSVLHSICPSLCLTLWGHWCSRACFYFSIFLLKLRKKLTHEGEPGGSRCWITVFILLLTGGGGKNAYPLEKMLNLRMKRAFCFGQK